MLHIFVFNHFQTLWCEWIYFIERAKIRENKRSNVITILAQYKICQTHTHTKRTEVSPSKVFREKWNEYIVL